MKRYVKSTRDYAHMADGDNHSHELTKFMHQLSKQYKEEFDNAAGLICVWYKLNSTYSRNNMYRIDEIPPKQSTYIIDHLKEWDYLKRRNAEVKLGVGDAGGYDRISIYIPKEPEEIEEY